MREFPHASGATPAQDGSARQVSLCFLLDAGLISGNCLVAEEDVAYRRIEHLRL